MNKAIFPRNLRVGDKSGSFTLESKSEYKTDTKGYITTWSSPKGLQVLFLSFDNFVGVDYYGRI